MTRKTKLLWKRFFHSMNIFNLPKTLDSFSGFDKITEFRLINSFVVALGFSMLLPVLTVLQGTLMLGWIIALFKIGDMLAVKSNEIFVNCFSINDLYKMTVILHVLYIFGAGIYFFNPVIMIYADSVFALLEMAIMSAYSITLNNHIAENHPKAMSKFQIIRNNSYANGALIGLLISTLTLYFLSLGWTLGVFLMINSFFAIWLIKNWNFYKNTSN